MDERAEEVLRWMIDSLRRWPPADAPVALAAANGGVAALLNVGLVSPAEAATWYERMREAAPGNAAARISQAIAVSTEVGGPSSVTRRSVGEEPPFEVPLADLKRHKPFQGRELLRIFPLSPQTLGVIELTALELFEDGVAVHWQHRDPPPGWSPSLELRDDAQSRYVMAGAAAHGGNGTSLAVMRGETVFVPGLPGSATRLEIAAGDSRVEVPLA